MLQSSQNSKFGDKFAMSVINFLHLGNYSFKFKIEQKPETEDSEGRGDDFRNKIRSK